MEHKIFGYVRISSEDQNEGRQIEKMKELGIAERDIIVDKKTGSNMDRENYQMLKHHLVRSGDTIVFDSLTRLGRNMENTLEEFKFYENNKINLKFIEEPYINLIHTDDHTNDIIQVAIKKSTLTVLSAFAQKEREDTHKRQAEGIALARKNGKHLGRPAIPITDDFIKSYNRWKAGEITAVKAMVECNLKKIPFINLQKNINKNLQNNNIAKTNH